MGTSESSRVDRSQRKQPAGKSAVAKGELTAGFTASGDLSHAEAPGESKVSLSAPHQLGHAQNYMENGLVGVIF